MSRRSENNPDIHHSAIQADEADPTQPAPGTAQLETLVDGARRAGLETTLTVTGKPSSLPAAVDLAAYRIIQESLTNTRKHAGCDTAVVRLGYTPGALSLAVEDEGKPVTRNSRPTPGGHGIAGMRERVTALGGRLSAGPRPGGGYRVFAELPLRAARIEGS